jgi:hypothetical protein
MSKKETLNLSKLVTSVKNDKMDHLLASRAIRDFQKLSEEAFQSLRGKYYRPADLVAGDEASTPVSG